MMERTLTWLEKAIVGAALLLIFGLAAYKVRSFDIFWQLQSARHMLETGAFIYQDTFSLAAEVSRFEHCWLHDLIFYGVYILGGYAAISLLKGFLVMAACAVALAVARARRSSWLSMALIMGPPLLLTRTGWLERPQLWTFLLFTVFILVLERYRQKPGKYLYGLIPLLVLWANLHAGVVVAFPLLLAYILGEGLSLWLRQREAPRAYYRRLLLLLPAFAVAIFLTPYGSELFITLLSAPFQGVDSGLMRHHFNVDWYPATFQVHPAFFFTMAGAAIVFVAGLWRRPNITDGLLFAGFAFMGWKVARHGPFFYLCIAALLPAYLDTAAGSIAPRISRKSRMVLRWVGVLAAVSIFAHYFLPVQRANGLFRTGLAKWYYPVEATRFVSENKLPANIFNTYDWGGYLMWHLYPDYRVFWDGRSDSENMFRLGMMVQRGDPGWEKIFDRFRVNTVITKACELYKGMRYHIIDRLRMHPDWRLVFAGKTSLVFVRAGSVDDAWLAAHILPDSRIDDTILSEAHLLIHDDPTRWYAYSEIAMIYARRNQLRSARPFLKRYLEIVPHKDPRAEAYFNKLEKALSRSSPSG